MATHKKTDDNEPKAPHPVESLGGFSGIVYGISSLIRARQAISAAPAGPVADLIAKAWAALSAPDAALLTKITSESSPNLWAISRSIHNETQLLIAPLYSEETIQAIVDALPALTQAILELAESASFKKAGEAYAPMIVNAGSPNSLTFPLMGLGVRTSIQRGGERTLVGAMLASEPHGALNSSRWLPMARDFANRKGADPEDFQALRQIEALPRDALTQQTASRLLRALGKSEPPMPALGVGISDLKKAHMIGDVALPSAEGLLRARQDIDAHKLASLGAIIGTDHGPYTDVLADASRELSKFAVAKVEHASLMALADVLSASTRATGALHDWIASPHWRQTILEAPTDSLPPEQTDQLAGLDRFLRLEISKFDEAVSEQNFKSISCWMLEHPEQAQTAMRAAIASSAFDKLDPASAAALDKSLGNRRSSTSQNNKPYRTTGSDKTGIAALAEAMSKKDASLGLAQWAANAHHYITPTVHTTSGGILADGFKSNSPSRLKLVAELESFAIAVRSANKAFFDSALSKAQLVQNAWLSSHGMLEAWTQAQTVGAASQNSISWARANPMQAQLDSADPVARLAGRLSRALGIQAAPEEQIKASLRAELSERGLSDDGWSMLAQSEKLRDFLAELGAKMNVKSKVETASNEHALIVACKAISAARRIGLESESAAPFCRALANPKHFETRFGAPLADGLSDAVAPVTVQDAASARAVSELALAKRRHQSSLFDALASDWAQTAKASLDIGLGMDQALAICTERATSFVQAMPMAMQLDWRKDSFSKMPAWQVFSKTSPLLAAALAAAAKGDALSAWCARIAPVMGVLHANGANDLIGKCKELIKEHCGASEASWRALTKSEKGMELYSGSINELARQGAFEQPHAYGPARLHPDACLDQADLQASSSIGKGGPSSATRLSLALNYATAYGVAPQTAIEVASALFSRREFENIFSESIAARSVDNPEAAEFFAVESEAKSSRMAKIMKEACGRHDKLARTRQDAEDKKIEPLPQAATEALRGEITDLCDWLRRSEYGLWQTLPEQPTWGQLSRLSRAWHDEERAREAERRSITQAKLAEEQAYDKLNPFRPRASERWAPILERHARDAWEAVELMSQQELSEEGSAMSHCVSGYSPYCREGQLRIFSIRLNGERKCTMEIRAASGKNLDALGADAQFIITQNKGRHNAAVSNPATVEFCNEALREAETSWHKGFMQLQVERAADKAEKAAKLAEKAKPPADGLASTPASVSEAPQALSLVNSLKIRIKAG